MDKRSIEQLEQYLYKRYHEEITAIRRESIICIAKVIFMIKFKTQWNQGA